MTHQLSPAGLKQALPILLDAGLTPFIEGPPGIGKSDVVAQVVEKAITARFPRSRYVVGRDARVAALAVRFLPDRLRTRLVRRI